MSMDYREIRLRNMEATIAALRAERREDRALIKEILSQVLSLTDRQTALLQEWTGMIAQRRKALDVTGAPRTFTLTDRMEYDQYMRKHHPELIDNETDSGDGIGPSEDRELEGSGERG